MYMHTYNTSNMVSESHPCLSLNSSLMLPLILVLNHACEQPVFLKLCLGVPYNSQKYACKNIVTYNSQDYAGTLGSGLLYSWFTPFQSINCHISQANVFWNKLIN